MYKALKILLSSATVAVLCLIYLNMTAGVGALPGFAPMASPNNLRTDDFSVIDGIATSTVQMGSSEIGTNKGQTCLWNGSNFTITNFPSNSITASISTSTSCE